MSLRTPVEVSACTTAIIAGAGCADEQPVRVDRLAPLGVDADDLGTVAARDLAHPLAEDAVDADDDRVAGPDEVDEGRLHAGGAGSAHGKGERVRRPEDLRAGGHSCCRAAPGTADRGVRASGPASAMVTSGYGFEGPGPISRRSDIPTGASWQVGAHLRQRAER